jgi:hypothetical protein
LTPAEQEQQICQYASGQKNEQDTIAKSAIHDPLINSETRLSSLALTAHV